MSSLTPSQTESSVPAAPPLSPSMISRPATAGISQGNRADQYLQAAEDLEHEVKYLIKPLCTLAKEQNKTVFTLVHDVNPVIQHGPMCGLVSLSIASQLLRRETYPPDYLLEQAKKKGYSKQGEMFSAKDLLELAQSSLKCTGTLINATSVETNDLLVAIADKVALVIAYDADKDHSPCLSKGHKAHWCTLVGFAIIADSALSSLPHANHVNLTPSDARHLLNNKLKKVNAHEIYLFARQGKSCHIGLWKYRSLMESNANLSEAGQHRNPSDYVIPTQGLSNSLSSIIVSLKS